MKTARAVAAFLDGKRARGLSEKTLSNYGYSLGKFARVVTVLPLKPEPIERFLADAGPEPETRDTYYCILQIFYRWLRVRKHIRRNPMVAIERPIVPPKVARWLTHDELKRLLAAPHPWVVRVFLLLIVDAGLRLSEALSVTAADLTGDTAIVSGKTGQREVPISPLVRIAVLNVGAWPWTRPDSASKAVRKAFARAGFTGKRASAHTLRHTFSELWEGDESILQGIMGHRSPRMLRKRYRLYNVPRALRQHQKHGPLNNL